MFKLLILVSFLNLIDILILSFFSFFDDPIVIKIITVTFIISVILFFLMAFLIIKIFGTKRKD
jgi:hypothetical protein